MLEPTILFENQDYLVLDKPAGWFSIPAREPAPSDLVLSQWLGPRAPFVVHRLDRYTSGVMLFAKSEASHREANQWFMNRKVKKIYHFLAAPRAGGEAPSRPAIQIKTPIEGKPAQTLFEILKKGSEAFYAQATPLTGRFHQIREHAEVAGFPLLGDNPYGGRVEITGKDGVVYPLPRFMLHARSLTLPFGEFQAPLPQDFSQLISVLI